jgi:uncharacterized membrane protein YkvA (DUF1232 family)
LGLLSPEVSEQLVNLQPVLLAAARSRTSGLWKGKREHLERWSARQQRRVRLEGVQGELLLPHGPGPLWPLLSASEWLHLGKGTTLGLGQLQLDDMA